jgi:hypothetical protein
MTTAERRSGFARKLFVLSSFIEELAGYGLGRTKDMVHVVFSGALHEHGLSLECIALVCSVLRGAVLGVFLIKLRIRFKRPHT